MGAARWEGEAMGRKIFVAEVQGQEGYPFEEQAIAAIEADDVDEARDFLLPAVQATCRQLFEARAERWDEGAPILIREATAAEAAEWRERKFVQLSNPTSPVVWLIDVEPKR
jgi:hypothetical protein